MTLSLCPRTFRLMLALFNRPLSREECDNLVPSTNGPHYVRELRRRLNLQLPCVRVPFVTIDGVKSWYGLYYATLDDKAKIQEVMAAIHATNDEQEKAPKDRG